MTVTGITDIVLGYCLITLALMLAGWLWTQATKRLMLTVSRHGIRVFRRELWKGCKVELTGTSLVGRVEWIYTHPEKRSRVLVEDIYDGNSGDDCCCPLAKCVDIADVARLRRESLAETFRRLRGRAA